MDKYEKLQKEIVNLINSNTEAFAWAMIKWYGYRDLHEEIDVIKEIIEEEKVG